MLFQVIKPPKRLRRWLKLQFLPVSHRNQCNNRMGCNVSLETSPIAVFLVIHGFWHSFWTSSSGHHDLDLVGWPCWPWWPCVLTCQLLASSSPPLCLSGYLAGLIGLKGWILRVGYAEVCVCVCVCVCVWEPDISFSIHATAIDEQWTPELRNLEWFIAIWMPIGLVQNVMCNPAR